MQVRDLVELRSALDTRVTRAVSDPQLRGRITDRLALLFPPDDDLGNLSPPLVTLRVALTLGVPTPQAMTLGAAACFFYAAADLADDLADEPPAGAALGLGINDVCALLFLNQLAALDLDSPHAAAVARVFAEAGLVMATGQAADLSSTDSLEPADPLAIAAKKGGGELAALIAAPAILVGIDATPWRQFGACLGTVLQIQSDYLDLFMKGSSDDWAAAKATLPIRALLADRALGARAELLLAGARRAATRQQEARWLLIRSGTAARYREVIDPLLFDMREAAQAAAANPVLEELARETEDLSLAIDEALAVLAASETPPTFVAAESELRQCRRAALAFLEADPEAIEAVEFHRWGLFGRDHVTAGLFGRLTIAEALRAAGIDAAPWAERALRLGDPDGWRYFPGCPEIPPDEDDTGLALQVLAAMGRARDPGAQVALAALGEHQGPDGMLPTWLTRSSDDGDEPGRIRWMGAHCPGAMANAVLGWFRARGADPQGDERWRRSADRLAALLANDAPPASDFYGPILVDALGLLTLSAIDDPVHAATRGRVAARLAHHRTLGGRFGTVLETAFAAAALGAAGCLDRPDSVRRALVDAQEADGGYPACPYYVTVGVDYAPASYGSRLVTTAVVLRALKALEAN